MDWEVRQGDCVELMTQMDEASVDAVVTDPPYGLEFMGNSWDRLDWRAGGGFSKPGIGERSTEWPAFGTGDSANATCAACGGRMRGAKRCKCAKPDWRVKGEPLETGFRGREQGRKMQEWHFRWALEAHRVLKPGGHLLAFGGSRTSHRLAAAVEDAGFEIRDTLMWVYAQGFPKSMNVGKAVGGDLAWRHPGDWNRLAGRGLEGYGTALKPSHEPITLARKPLEGSVAANVLEFGVGALNIEDCNVGEDVLRWPTNLAFDEQAAAELDDHSGDRPGGGYPAERGDNSIFNKASGGSAGPRSMGDRGGASRFFFCPKVTRAERDIGLKDFDPKAMYWSSGDQSPGTFQSSGTNKSARNHHPTVKPIELMRWLCRLVTPPEGLVLDLFAGSGSTGCAAVLEGFNFLGMEAETEYVAIAEARIAHWARFERADTERALRAAVRQELIREAGQLDLLA